MNKPREISEELKQIYKEVGIEIRNKRLQLGYTQVELAEMSGVSVSTISNMEHGDTKCEERIRKIMAILDIPMKKLYGENQKTYPFEKTVKKGLTIYTCGRCGNAMLKPTGGTVNWCNHCGARRKIV
jgi:ribosome-binding protein aMBF1 (putative translation factor)